MESIHDNYPNEPFKDRKIPQTLFSFLIIDFSNKYSMSKTNNYR